MMVSLLFTFPSYDGFKVKDEAPHKKKRRWLQNNSVPAPVSFCDTPDTAYIIPLLPAANEENIIQLFPSSFCRGRSRSV
jgi:hypothetical protein